jgi:alginate O-acetyltransferase complex protein AlgI
MNLLGEISMVDAGFIGALLVAIGLRWFTPAKWHVLIGVAVSAAVIGYVSKPTLALLGGTALLIYPLGRWIGARRESHPRAAKWGLGLGIAAILGTWALFKLNRDFELPFLMSGDQRNEFAKQLFGLIGFSYFIFKAINVLYMHYLMGNVPNANPLRTLYFSLFPPTLTSGPIQKYADFCRECTALQPLNWSNVCTGVERITRGYFYKVCVAALFQLGNDKLLAVAEPNAYISIATIAGLYLFFFFDFCGYSHIAVGFGLLLGIRVPENFKTPFLATSVTEFWRNWHITIGDWFRDHIFIPLGGMRLGGIRASLLAASIMLVCGLWHGVTWIFMCWGAWHASMLLIEGLTGSKPMPPAERHGPKFWWRCFFTNAKVAFGAIFFLDSFSKIGTLLGGFLRWW